MIESKLWHKRVETKKVKGIKVVGLNKTCGNTLTSLILVISSTPWFPSPPLFLLGRINIQKMLSGGNG